MKLLVLTIIVVFLLLARNDQRNMEEVEGSKHFYLSDGKSKQIYEQMKRDKLSEQSLKEFVYMEDRFLQLEKMSVCQQISYASEATGISENIKTRFGHYDFRYHQVHIKQCSEPNRLINNKIICYY
jgi:hypothetical protein